MWEQNNNKELRHYGVIGMKWGIRKKVGKALGKTTQKKAPKKNPYLVAEKKPKKTENKVKKIIGGAILGVAIVNIATEGKLVREAGKKAAIAYANSKFGKRPIRKGAIDAAFTIVD